MQEADKTDFIKVNLEAWDKGLVLHELILLLIKFRTWGKNDRFISFRINQEPRYFPD